VIRALTTADLGFTSAEVGALLGPALRQRLGNELLDSTLDEPPGAMTDEEILAEAIRRDDEMESGKVKPITHKDMMRWIKQQR
jgi:hypothetical protein